MLEDTRGSNDSNTLEEMRSIMDILRRKNQILENKVYNTQQHQAEAIPTEDMEVLDP